MLQIDNLYFISTRNVRGKQARARALRLTLSIAALTAKNPIAITARIAMIAGSVFFRFIQ
jgi:hypothetical protein